LKHFYDEYGLSSVTVASPTLARLIKEALPTFRVGASLLMGISTPAQVLMVQEFVDSIVLDNRLLRDLRGLRRMRSDFSGEICLIVNEACLPGCVYRTQHFYEMGYSETEPESLCQQMLDEMPWMRLTGAWVLPQHLHYYDGLYNSLKLAGRVTLRDPARYFQVLGAYVRRESILPRDIGGGPASLTEAIDMPDVLFEKILRCDKNCVVCGVCHAYYKQALVSHSQGINFHVEAG
jgi:collagenase-like PrtC family protease